MTGSVTAIFSINSATCQILVYTPPNFEAIAVYVLTVVITDKGGLTATTAVTINILDINEAPVYMGALSASLQENSPTNTMLMQVRAAAAAVRGLLVRAVPLRACL